MYVLINSDNSINCVSDTPFTVEHHEGLTLVVTQGDTETLFPKGISDWIDLFFDHDSEQFLTKTEYENLNLDPLLVVDAKIDSINSALREHLDEAAKSKNYDSIHTAALRAALPNSPFYAEGVAFGEWMDACYAKGYELIASWQDGVLPELTIDSVIEALPPLVLPE